MQLSFLPLYISYPSWIHPQLFPSIPILNLIRWYGLMYIVAFSIAYSILKKVMTEGMLDSASTKATEDELFSFLTTGIIFLLIGARIFSTLVYDTSGIYWHKPWLIFWPYDDIGHFTGLAGMSYHGGFIGGAIGIVFWCKTHNKPLLSWIDAMAIAIPAGYTFGRIGNFFNGELYGKVTTKPWGIIFPGAEKYSLSIDWVKQVAEQAGMDISQNSTLINLPRHPSQLYEALFEGLVLFLIIWFLRKKKPFDGFLTSVYIVGYGFFRFIIEYFREPDADIGYRITVEKTASIARTTSLLNISTGQILCFMMIVGGILFGLLCWKKQKLDT
ncbi:MAG: prolipoprotein diacylglyceryl transferase [Treponema sp.]|nr:prolipoprotein diacylglyceryl transferase [Treponema sp.]